MCRLIESIKVRNRQFEQLFYHNERLNRSRFMVFGLHEKIDLAQTLKIPDKLDMRTYKCRVVYASEIEHVAFIPYQIKPLQYLKLVESNLTYDYKYENRQALDGLTADLPPDYDALIVKNGFLTDLSYANICFWDGTDWISPERPLLPGTKRAYYLDRGIIKLANIKPSDIKQFEFASPINAMLDLEDVVIKSDFILF